MKKIICLMLIIVLSFGMVTSSFADSGRIKEEKEKGEKNEIKIPEYEVERQEMLQIDKIVDSKMLAVSRKKILSDETLRKYHVPNSIPSYEYRHVKIAT